LRCCEFGCGKKLRNHKRIKGKVKFTLYFAFSLNFGPPELVPGLITAMASEEERSRVYGGIHFTFDQTAGQSAGRNVANYVFLNFMKPRCDR
jgi:hypothetical protein